jgi:hypothetical protein
MLFSDQIIVLVSEQTSKALLFRPVARGGAEGKQALPQQFPGSTQLYHQGERITTIPQGRKINGFTSFT